MNQIGRAAAIAVLLAAARAWAQQPPPNIDQESQDQRRRGGLEQKAAAAAQEAEAGSLAGEPTFEDILRSPDDVNLNMRFARAQIRKGDLRGAATTLERLVMLRPEDARVRLLYAVVLYRLDDAVEAQREIETVLRAPGLPPDVRGEASRYLALARARQRDTHYDARLSFGFGWDDNRNAAPGGGGALFQGVVVPLDAGSQRKKDTNLQFVGSLGASHDFGGPRGHSMFGRLTYYRGEQTVYRILNLQAYSAKLGSVLRTRWAELTPSVSYDHVLLHQSIYLRSRNAGLRVERRLSRAMTGWLEFGHSYQDFANTPQLATAEDRTGEQLDSTLGAAWTPAPADRLSLSVLHRRKFARQAFDAYRRESGTLEWLHLLGRGAFFQGAFTGQLDRYEIPDATVVSGVVRHDDGWRAQALLGAPLSLFWSPLRDFTGTIGYEYFRQTSNVVNYDYFNHNATVLLTYKWGM
ncbi:MAG: DUF560 domain-containing protein [Elusimicrobia bacterium]|nr:DUF560 domain-containing protein [Elusimicrobiota bacterium]